MPNLKISLSLIVSLIMLSSCASVPDVWGCRSRSVNTGFCTKSISNVNQIVDDEHPLLTGDGYKTWLDIKIEAIYIPADSWAAFKKFMIKICKKSNQCNGDIDNWTQKIDSLNPGAM